MIYTNPVIYRYICTAGSSLLTLPLDIVQVKIISTDNIVIDVAEFKWLLLFPLILTSQNIVYSRLSCIKNIICRGALAGAITSPIYAYLETRKMYSRLHIFPNYNIYARIIFLRQALLFAILYKIGSLNIPHATFLSALIANAVGFPLKMFALKNSYPIFEINKKTIKIVGLLEIIKTSISDGLALLLINHIS